MRPRCSYFPSFPPGPPSSRPPGPLQEPPIWPSCFHSGPQSSHLRQPETFLGSHHSLSVHHFHSCIPWAKNSARPQINLSSTCGMNEIMQCGWGTSNAAGAFGHLRSLIRPVIDRERVRYLPLNLSHSDTCQPTVYLIPPLPIAMKQEMLCMSGVVGKGMSAQTKAGIKKSSADSGSFKQLHTYLAVMIAQVTPIIKRIITCFAKIPRKWLKMWYFSTNEVVSEEVGC